MRKPARASNLTIRFYESDGWSEEILKKYLKSGEIHSSRLRFGDAPEIAYFTFHIGSLVDLDGLMTEISWVGRMFSDQGRYTDREMLERQLT